MKLQFSKYHGTGNDFIMVDSRRNVMPDRPVATIAALCNRHFGIGADGLIVLEESEAADFRMSYYNSDGNPGTMCGNGGRCATLFAKRSGWIKSDICRFEAADGMHEAVLLSSAMDSSFGEAGNRNINFSGMVQLGLQDVTRVERVFEGYLLDTGSPHLVLFVGDVEKVEVVPMGRKFRRDERFRDGINVNFVQKGAGEIIVRTYERGVEDETLSCGTGVTAAAMATFLDSGEFGNPIAVKTRGGELVVDFQPSEKRDHFTGVYLTGPVTEVFEGIIDPEIFTNL